MSTLKDKGQQGFPLVSEKDGKREGKGVVAAAACTQPARGGWETDGSRMTTSRAFLWLGLGGNQNMRNDKTWYGDDRDRIKERVL